ncbi:MAG: 23S rRNA (guanosine(2251)-2'-O)-methyltransferase RlmB [Bacteroidia bacterium]|nr:23S rRNA (guanosine(2251)-2'-O)-methyltransferase RlmB [Bacteroidia bacterium]MCF8426318.1 23S rRNA (guanosine(2251)-2'-O)-methyltransferase RlmB [Bacteroidia bacterium]MCF8447071.1 23S rRNA (guanosine(2251)-2'-O)-methyltransferase RlmB [Bacteroidia bacterium]
MSQSTIYGVHAIKEAFDAGSELSKVLVQKGMLGGGIEDIISLCRKSQIPVQYVPKEKFYSFKNKNHQGVVAYISPISYYSIEQIVPKIFEDGETPFILVLDRLTDVRNLGAIARTALCAGVHAIVIPQTDSAPVNEDAVKTSAGALLKIPVCREKNLKTVMEYLNQSGFNTLGCTEKASDGLDQIDLTGPLAIVMGNEETGISNDVLKKCSALGKIPMDFGVSSLNVSVAAGIAMYEALMQRKIAH